MKKSFTLCVALCITLAGMAQIDSTKQVPKDDTIRIGGMIIIRDKDKKNQRVEDDTTTTTTRQRRGGQSRVSSNWLIFDLGVSNYVDNTNYAGAEAQAYAPGSNETWFKLRGGKSRNVNIWIYMQRLSLIKNVVNLKYGVGLELNNYYYKQAVRYIETPQTIVNPPRVFLDATPNRQYEKSKLAADYLTVPVMLNFNFTPNKERGFGFSAGVSAGYLYSARNKTVTSDEGKKKAKDDFELERWKISYIAELSLGPVRFYGSYALKNMFERGLDMKPYTLGIRFSNW